VPVSPLAYGLSAPPHILHNPAQQILAYAGFCPTTGTLPAASPCPLSLQQSSSSPTSPATDPSIQGRVAPAQPSCHGGPPPSALPSYAPVHFLPGEKPPPYAP
ncbi:hypothetical protein MC885_021756, partial [Smutsia gigantea]